MRLPAGKYFIGDPCYAINDTKENPNRWSDFCDAIDKSGYTVTEFEGVPMFADSTAFGDGTYPGSDGFEYGVDAGMIGCVPLELATEEMKEMKRLGTIVEFKKPFDVDSDNGFFTFGHITIDTGDSNEDIDEDTD